MPARAVHYYEVSTGIEIAKPVGRCLDVLLCNSVAPLILDRKPDEQLMSQAVRGLKTADFDSMTVEIRALKSQTRDVAPVVTPRSKKPLKGSVGSDIDGSNDLRSFDQDLDDPRRLVDIDKAKLDLMERLLEEGSKKYALIKEERVQSGLLAAFPDRMRAALSQPLQDLFTKVASEVLNTIEFFDEESGTSSFIQNGLAREI